MTTEHVSREVTSGTRTCPTCRWFLAQDEGQLRDVTGAFCNCFHSPRYGFLEQKGGLPDGCDLHWLGPPWMKWWAEWYCDKEGVSARVHLAHCASVCGHYNHVLYPCQSKGPCCWPGMASLEQLRKWAKNRPELSGDENGG